MAGRISNLPPVLRAAGLGRARFVLLTLLLAGCGTAAPGDAQQGTSTADACDLSDGGHHAGICQDFKPDWPAGPEDDIKGLPAAQAKYKTCSSLWTCGLAACGSNPGPDCLNPCLQAASSEMLAAFADVTKCAVHVCANKQCKVSGAKGCVAQCMWSRCLGFAAACSAATNVEGSTDCGEALDCIKLCDGQMSCLSDCYSAMQTSGQNAFLTLWSCIATSPAANPFVDCYDTALACSNSDAEAGDKPCYDVLQCSGACGDELTDQEFDCNAGCYRQGTKSAQKQFTEVVNCYTGFSQGKPPGDCASVLAQCVQPQGELTCPEIDPCTVACRKSGKSQGVCTFECLKKASPQEGLRFLDLMLCGSVTCAQQCRDSNDDGCGAGCRTTACKSLKNKCLGL